MYQHICRIVQGQHRHSKDNARNFSLIFGYFSQKRFILKFAALKSLALSIDTRLVLGVRDRPPEHDSPTRDTDPF